MDLSFLVAGPYLLCALIFEIYPHVFVSILEIEIHNFKMQIRKTRNADNGTHRNADNGYLWVWILATYLACYSHSSRYLVHGLLMNLGLYIMSWVRL